MKRHAKTLCIPLFGLLLLFALSDADIAQGTGGIGFEIIKGEGSVCAAGQGIFQFTGSGKLVAKTDMGQLLINDESAVVEIQGHGVKKTFINGWVLYEGLQGTVRLEGENVFGQLAGMNVRAGAAGEGVVLLMGKGVFKSPCGDPNTPWTKFEPVGIGIELGDYIIGSEPINP